MKRVPKGFVPPPRKPNAGPPAPVGLYVEPTEEVLLVGEMFYDAQTMVELLGDLPFERDSYRANLRIVCGASIRMAARCARLLGEIELKTATYRRDGTENPGPEMPPGAGANLIAHPPAEAGDSHPTRNKAKLARHLRRDLAPPTAKPVPDGVRASILRILAKGPLTSDELAHRVGGVHASIYSTLTILRKEGLVESHDHEEGDGLRKNFLVVREEAATA